MTLLIPCGKTLGHGESCSEGYLCEQCAEIERLRRNQMSTGYNTLAKTAALQAQEADACKREANAQQQRAESLEYKCEQLAKALVSAMGLVDELLRENGRLCAASNEPPSMRLFAAKNSFDATMKRLLGDQPPEPPSPT